MIDEETFHAWQGGDRNAARKAQEQLWKHNYGQVYAFLCKTGSNHHLAEQFATDSFPQAWEEIDYNVRAGIFLWFGEQAFNALARRVWIRRAQDCRRAWRVEPQMPVVSPDPDGEELEIELPASEHSDPTFAEIASKDKIDYTIQELARILEQARIAHQEERTLMRLIQFTISFLKRIVAECEGETMQSFPIDGADWRKYLLQELPDVSRNVLDQTVRRRFQPLLKEIWEKYDCS